MATISPLHQRILDDMKARQLAAGTQRGYVLSCRRFTAFLGRSPDTATGEELRRFQLHLSESGISIPNRNRTMTGLRFLFRVTLGRLDHVGPLTRTVRDAAITLKWLAGYDPRDPGCADEPVDDYHSALDAGVKDVRIGVPRNYFFDFVDGEVDTAVRAANSKLETLGAVVKEVDIP